MQRILTALVLLPTLWYLTRIPQAWVFDAIILLIVGIAGWESFRLFEARGYRPFKVAGLVTLMAIGWSFTDHEPRFGVELPLTAMFIAVAVAAMASRPDPPAMRNTLITTIVPVMLIAFTLGYLILLRHVPGHGRDLIYLAFTCTILGDTAAYYVGKAIGRRKLAPRISPNKTWAGAVAAVLAAIAAALIAHLWFFRHLSLVHALFVGAVLGLAGIGGDLAESMFKRAADLKDSSTLLPGHGGALDRVDSVMFAAPVLYYYHLLFLG